MVRSFSINRTIRKNFLTDNMLLINSFGLVIEEDMFKVMYLYDYVLFWDVVFKRKSRAWKSNQIMNARPAGILLFWGIFPKNSI